MAWTTPSTRSTGDLITAAIWNADLVNNLIELRGGGVAIASQAALDFLYASSSTQLARLAKGAALSGVRLNAAATAYEFALPKVEQTTASSSTVTPTTDTVNLVTITAQAAGLTLANPSPATASYQGQPLVIRIKDNGTARSITYGTQYRGIALTLPATTVISKTLYMGFMWNSTDTTWDLLAVAQQA